MSGARTRRAVARSLAASPALALRPSGAMAQRDPATAPYRPGRMIVPLPPGSSPDAAGRLFADGLARRRGHPIAVENRVGASGAVAGGAFAQARPGDALFFGMGDLLTVAPLTEANSPFAEAAAFLPVSTAATDFMAVSVPASLPVGSLAGLVDHARARPGALNWFAQPGTAVAEWHDASADRFLVPIRHGDGAERSLRFDFPTIGLEGTFCPARQRDHRPGGRGGRGLGPARQPRSAGAGASPSKTGGCAATASLARRAPASKLYVRKARRPLARPPLRKLRRLENGTLARADTLAFYRSGGSMTSAHLLPVDGGRVRETPPAHSFPLGRVAAP